MKKVLSIVLVLALALSLAACKPAEKEITLEEDAKLVVWESPGNELEFMKEIAKRFEEEYGIPVTVEEVDHTKTGERLALDGPAGVGADVIAAPHDHTGNLVEQGLIVEAEYADRLKKEMDKNAVDAVSFNGTVYGYPRAMETYLLYYNKDILPEAPKTIAELIEWGKTYTDVNANKYAFMMDVGNAYFNQAFLAGGGGYIFKDNTDKDDIGIDSKGAIDGITEWKSLKEILPVPSGDSDYVAMMGLFTEGKVGAIINGPWALGEVRDSGINYGLAKIPALANGPARPFSGVRGLFVSTYSEYPNAAQQFANFYTSEANLVDRYEATGQIPTHKGADKIEALKNDPDASMIAEQIKDAIPMPSIPEVQLFWGPVGAVYGQVWNDEKTVEEALKDAAEQLRSDIAEQEEE